jgi:hypothetical protein
MFGHLESFYWKLSLDFQFGCHSNVELLQPLENLFLVLVFLEFKVEKEKEF